MHNGLIGSLLRCRLVSISGGGKLAVSLVALHQVSFSAHSAHIIYYLLWCSSLILLSGEIETNSGPISSSLQCFSICHWNLNSITTHNYVKLSPLTAYNLVHSFDNICLSEKYLNSETSPNDTCLE